MTAEDAHAVIGRDAEFQAVMRSLDCRPRPVRLRSCSAASPVSERRRSGTRRSCAPRRVLHRRCRVVRVRQKRICRTRVSAISSPRIDDDVMHGVPAPQRRALDVALLRADAGTSPLQQRAVSAAALQVLIDLARSAPVVLAIDDLQWMDSPSVNVLRFALRRIGPARVGVLVASRAGASEDDRLGLADALPPGARRTVDCRPARHVRIGPRAALSSAHHLPGPDASPRPRDVRRQSVLRSRARTVAARPRRQHRARATVPRTLDAPRAPRRAPRTRSRRRHGARCSPRPRLPVPRSISCSRRRRTTASRPPHSMKRSPPR